MSGSRGRELRVEASLHARDVRIDAEEQLERHRALEHRHAVAVECAAAVLSRRALEKAAGLADNAPWNRVH